MVIITVEKSRNGGRKIGIASRDFMGVKVASGVGMPPFLSMELDHEKQEVVIKFHENDVEVRVPSPTMKDIAKHVEGIQ